MKYIGLDLGSVTCGISKSDTGRFAMAVKTLRFKPDDYNAAFDMLLDYFEEEKPDGIVLGYTLLENGVQITGTFTDGGLTLSADPGFAYDLFKAPQVLDEFRAVASELCGRTVPVKLEAAAAAAPDQASRNLEQLMHRKGITIKS